MSKGVAIFQPGEKAKLQELLDAGLSGRDRFIATHRVDGYTFKRIADLLGISGRRVQSLKVRILNRGVFSVGLERKFNRMMDDRLRDIGIANLIAFGEKKDGNTQ